MQQGRKQLNRSFLRKYFSGLHCWWSGLSSVLMIAIGFAAPLGAGEPIGAASAVAPEVAQKLDQLQVPFVMNQGQTDKRVKFYAQTVDGTAYVTHHGEIIYDLPARKGKGAAGWSIKEELIGARIRSVEGQDQTETNVSYFVGSSKSKWKPSIPTYRLVAMGDVYNGVALKLKLTGTSVEKLFYVNPGARPEDIKVRITGATSLRTNLKGELEAETGLGAVTFTRPRAFQRIEGRTHDVPVEYAVEGNAYGFKVGGYDRTNELVIDPSIQATYLGGRGSDFPFSVIALRTRVYVAGSTDSVNFPGTTGGAQPAKSGPRDAFLAILRSDLKTVIQATYLGGSGNDDAFSIALSGTNLYVTGNTDSANFPGTAAGAQSYNAGLGDGFVGLLTSDLKTLISATYLGGSYEESAFALAVTGSNSPYGVFVVGSTRSPNFPRTAGGAQASGAGPVQFDGGLVTDAFAAVLSSDLTTLTQATYLGGTSLDRASAIAAVPGFIYVAGGTQSTNFPNTGGGAQPNFGGLLMDGFAALLTSDLTTLVRATYLGGKNTDEAKAIAISGTNVYVVGETASTDFPGTLGGAQPVNAGFFDGFVARLDSSLSTLTQATYLGGGGQLPSFGFDRASAVAVSPLDGAVYVAGTTDSLSFPGTADGPQPTFGGFCGENEPHCHDGFAARLTADLKTVTRASYLGGSGNDNAVAITLSGFFPISIFQRESIVVAGSTSSTNFPGTAGSAQPMNGGGGADGFVANLTLAPTFGGVLNAIETFYAAGCIDSEKVSGMLAGKVAEAQALSQAGLNRDAINTLNTLIHDIQGESGKYISTSCASDGVIFDAGIRLITDLLGLIYYLEGSDATGSVRGYVVDSRAGGIAGATVMIRDSKQVITAVTDASGFYLVAAANVLTRGVTYTVEVSGIPSRATITPASQKFTWGGSSITLDNFVAQ